MTLEERTNALFTTVLVSPGSQIGPADMLKLHAGVAEALRTIRDETLENLAHDDRAIDLVARAMCRHETEMFARDHGMSVADLPCPDKTAKSTVYRECAIAALSAIRSLKSEVSRERETG